MLVKGDPVVKTCELCWNISKLLQQLTTRRKKPQSTLSNIDDENKYKCQKFILGLMETVLIYYSDVTFTSWRLKSPAPSPSVQLFVQAHIKENIKAPRHWPVDSPHKGPVAWKCFHWMTSSYSGTNLCNDLKYHSNFASHLYQTCAWYPNST